MANYIKDILTINYKSTMKKLVKVVFLGLSLACASCADDENVQSYTQEVKLPHVVAISSSSSITRCSNKNQNEKILAFDSEADFNQFSSYLKGKNSKQREEILSKLGFECLQEINERQTKNLKRLGLMQNQKKTSKLNMQLIRKSTMEFWCQIHLIHQICLSISLQHKTLSLRLSL